MEKYLTLNYTITTTKLRYYFFTKLEENSKMLIISIQYTLHCGVPLFFGHHIQKSYFLYLTRKLDQITSFLITHSFHIFSQHLGYYAADVAILPLLIHLIRLRNIRGKK